MARSAAIRIGELAQRTGCTIETIRYYERVGLLRHPPRSAGRYRLYETEDVRRLAFVRRARELGFTLNEVRTLLALSADHGDSTCGEVRELAARHLADVRVKIADLRAMERALTEAMRRCDAGQLSAERHALGNCASRSCVSSASTLLGQRRISVFMPNFLRYPQSLCVGIEYRNLRGPKPQHTDGIFCRAFISPCRSLLDGSRHKILIETIPEIRGQPG